MPRPPPKIPGRLLKFVRTAIPLLGGRKKFLRKCQFVRTRKSIRGTTYRGQVLVVGRDCGRALDRRFDREKCGTRYIPRGPYRVNFYDSRYVPVKTEFVCHILGPSLHRTTLRWGTYVRDYSSSRIHEFILGAANAREAICRASTTYNVPRTWTVGRTGVPRWPLPYRAVYRTELLYADKGVVVRTEPSTERKGYTRTHTRTGVVLPNRGP